MTSRLHYHRGIEGTENCAQEKKRTDQTVGEMEAVEMEG